MSWLWRSHLLSAATPGVVALAGLAYAVHSLSYGLGSLPDLGPGAVPLFAGSVLAVCGTSVVVGNVRGSRETEKAPAEGEIHDGSDDVYRPRFPKAVTLVSVVLLVAIVLWQANIVGLSVATAVLVGVCAFLMRVKPPTAFLTGLAFYGVAYVGFEYWLGIPLPHGYF